MVELTFPYGCLKFHLTFAKYTPQRLTETCRLHTKLASECSRLHETHSRTTEPCKLQVTIDLGVVSSTWNALQGHKTKHYILSKLTLERSCLYQIQSRATQPCKLHVKIDLGVVSSTQNAFQTAKTNSRATRR